jgi:hypothetical protein
VIGLYSHAQSGERWLRFGDPALLHVVAHVVRIASRCIVVEREYRFTRSIFIETVDKSRSRAAAGLRSAPSAVGSLPNVPSSCFVPLGSGRGRDEDVVVLMSGNRDNARAERRERSSAVDLVPRSSDLILSVASVVLIDYDVDVLAARVNGESAGAPPKATLAGTIGESEPSAGGGPPTAVHASRQSRWHWFL